MRVASNRQPIGTLPGAMSAVQSCQAEGGYSDIGTDYCEIGN